MKISIAIVTCTALLVGAGSCRGVEPGRFLPRQAGSPNGGPARAAAVRDSLGLRSPGAAFRMSLAGTMVPFVGAMLLSGDDEDESPHTAATALGTIGMVLGPSLGYFYGGCSRRALTGIAVRAGLLAVTAIAASKAEWPTIGVFGAGEEGNAAAGITVLAATALGVATVVDLVRVSGTVSRQNDRRVGAAAAVTPTVHTLRGSGGVGVGLQVRL